MNNVMDETSQEIADLKSDLVEAQREIARLENELQAAYTEKTVTAEEELERANYKELMAVRSKHDDLERNMRHLEQEVGELQVKNTALQADLIAALALTEVLRMNPKDAWSYFSGPQGRERLKWATDRYAIEMKAFTSALSKER